MVRAQARTSKLNFWGEETLELLKKKNWWLLFMYYRGTKTINPSGLFEKFT